MGYQLTTTSTSAAGLRCDGHRAKIGVSFAICLSIWFGLFNDAVADQAVAIVVTPAEVKLSGNLSRAQLVVTRADAGGQIGERSDDLTHGAASRQ